MRKRSYLAMTYYVRNGCIQRNETIRINSKIVLVSRTETVWERVGG